MLSRLGRFIRGRFGRSRRRGTEDEGIVEERIARETPPEAGDAFAQEVLRRVRPPAVSRVPKRSSLAVSGRQSLIQAEAPRVRNDVPTVALPLATSAHPGAPPEQVEADQVPGGDTQFYEGSTGDARWDALWAMRGTPRATGESTSPDHDSSVPRTPRERQAQSRSAPAGRGASVQRAPSPPTRDTGPAGEALAPRREPPVQRTLGETAQEDVAHEATGEETAPSRPLPPSQDEPRAPSPATLRRAGEGVTSVAQAADAPLPSPGQESTRPPPTPAPEPPRVGRRIVPRSTLEELPTRREAPPPAPSPEPAPEPVPRVSADRELASAEEPVPVSADAAPPPAGAPVQRVLAVPETAEAAPTEGIPSGEERRSEVPPADRVPPAARQVAPDQPRTRAGPTGPRMPSPVQRTPTQDADRPFESPPVAGQVPPAQRVATGAEPAPEETAQEPPSLSAQDEPPAVQRPPGVRQAAEPSLDRQLSAERPSAEPSLPKRTEPVRSEERRATAPEPPLATDGETGRDRLPSGLPSTARGAPAESAHPAAVVEQPVQARPTVPTSAERPVEGPAVQEPAPQKPGVQQRAAQGSAAPEPTVQTSAEEPAPEKPGAEPGLPEAQSPARDRPAPSGVGARPIEYTAEAPQVSAAAARIRRDADAESAGERGPDRRTLLRQAMQPRIVPMVLQAAPADDTRAAGPTGAAATPGGAAGAPEGAEEPDVESLARDVYRILRRRLLVERERDLGAG